jgi:hypothetical protein
MGQGSGRCATISSEAQNSGIFILPGNIGQEEQKMSSWFDVANS